MDALYFEAHITLEPTTDRLKACMLDQLCSEHGFKTSSLLDHESGDRRMDFANGRVEGSEGEAGAARLRASGNALLFKLAAHGFTPRRFKVEAIVYDTKAITCPG